MKCKCIKKVQLVTDPNCTFLLSLVAVFLVADAAGVRQVADIGADAYDATDGFYGEHEAGVCELNAAGFGFAEQAEQLGLL